MRINTLWAAGLAMLGGLVAGAPACDSEPLRLAETASCTTSSECPAYAACADGMCRIRCDESVRCPYSRTFCNGETYDPQCADTPLTTVDVMTCESNLCVDKCQVHNIERQIDAKAVNGLVAVDSSHAYWVASPEIVTESDTFYDGPKLVRTLSIWRSPLQSEAPELVARITPPPGLTETSDWLPDAIHSTGANVYLIHKAFDTELKRHFYLTRVTVADRKQEALGEIALFGSSSPTGSSPPIPKAFFVDTDLLYVPFGETAWRRRNLDTGVLDADFSETQIVAPVASAQRLTWISRRDPTTTSWEFRYLDLPDGAPTWSSVAAPEDVSPNILPRGATKPDEVAALGELRSVESFGAVGTRIFYYTYADNARLSVNQIDTSQPGAVPVNAFFVPMERGTLPREMAFVGDDFLSYGEPIEQMLPENATSAEIEARSNLTQVCGLVIAHSLTTGARRVVGGRTGAVGGLLASGDLFVQGADPLTESYASSSRPNVQPITLRTRAALLPTPVP